MKKLFIFLSIALVFIMVSSSFLSIGKIFDKDSDKTEEPGFVTLPGSGSSEPELFTVYAGGEAITDLSMLSDPKYNETVVYYIDDTDSVVYFAYIMNNDVLDKSTFMNDMAGKDLFGNPVLNKITYDFNHIFDLGGTDIADHRDYLSESDYNGFLACIFISIPYNSSTDYATEAERFLTDMGPWLSVNDPINLEGPSAGDNTEPEPTPEVTTPATTEPQIYPSIPEVPGAE